MWIALAAWYAAINLLAALMVRGDKRSAEAHRWRTPERRFRWLSVLGGGPGVLVGFRLFHHKTKHRALQASVLLLMLLNFALLALLIIGTTRSAG